MGLEVKLRKIIGSVVAPTRPIEEIDIDDDLQNVGMDSLVFVRLIVEMENKLDLEFPEEMMLITKARTIRQLCEVVRSIKEE